MSSINRLHNITNPYQGKFRKVLSVCSAGLLRSPTIAWVLAQKPYEYNTRACGANDDYALIKLDNVLLSWADEIVVVDKEIEELCKGMLEASVLGGRQKPIYNLELPDTYSYRQPELIDLVVERYNGLQPPEE